MRISCAVNNITNAGILAHIDEGEYSPLKIFIARDHHYNIPYFSELKEKDIIMVRVIGQRFELNDPFVSVIGELELRQERESRSSIRHPVETAQKKGTKLSLILEENSDMLGEFQLEKDLAASKQRGSEDDAEEEGEGEGETGEEKGEGEEEEEEPESESEVVDEEEEKDKEEEGKEEEKEEE